MLLTVLSVPDCPNVAVMLDRVRAVLGDHADVGVIVVEDDERAGAWGMTGSPTLLVDGVDPFATVGVAASVSCRLYRGGDCAVGGAPALAELREVLGAAAHRAPAGGGVMGSAVDRGGRGRLAPRAGGLRAVQQAALREVAFGGLPPAADELDRVAAPFGRRGLDLLRELAAEDHLTLGHGDQVRAIYPFSSAPTRHRVRIEGGALVWAMCAVDALGIAPMLGRPTVIDTTDPVTAEALRITAGPESVSGEPGTVVYLGARPEAGPAERTCCATINFFSSRHSATRWAAVHPEVGGRIAELAEAASLGRAVFGGLLAQ